MSKQNFYKARRARMRREVDEGLVLELVRAERRLQPRLGARKLLVRIAVALSEAGVEIGRDRFFELLGEWDLLVPGLRSTPRTTNSRHGFRTYPNLLKLQELCGAHEAWVCDLTYLRTLDGFVYLALVMDVFSRKIVGWHVGNTLEASGCVRAVKMAMRQLPVGAAPIHHSDRGTQYSCWQYVCLLEGRGIVISMTEENHCYENGKAERLNGILKQEYGLGETLRNRETAGKMVEAAVGLYNRCRPHAALGMRYPELVHRPRPVAA